MTAAKRPFISVVVAVFNGEKTIAACLESLLRQDYPLQQREILVVDNGSRDKTAEIIKGYPVRYLYEGTFQGPSAARNRALSEVKGEIVAFTDADCVVAQNWLLQALKGFSSEKIGCVAGEILSFKPTTLAQYYAQTRGLLSQAQALTESFRPYAQTANVLYRLFVLERLHGFDPALRVGEDADLAWRMQEELGLEIAFVKEAIVYHQHRECLSDLLKQRIGYGYGSVLLYLKYRNQMGKWTFKHTLWEMKSLLRKCVRLIRVIGRRILLLGRRAPSSNDDSAIMVLLEILVFLARKVGQAKGSLQHRVWYV